MKKKLTKVALAATIATMPLVADDYTFHTKSLFAVEGGYNKIVGDITDTSATIPTYNLGVKNKGILHLGVKIGAESDNYRVFLSARTYDTGNDLNRLNTYGGEIQYKFNFAKIANFFVGANGGIADIRISDNPGTSTYPAAKAQSTYYGGDLGFNIHATSRFDIELGYRYSKIKDDITQGTNVYNVDYLSGLYGSFIVRWEMD